MIELTVKTLDSQNHAFSVDDDITVAQFKEKIAETVNIPADTQRIIYCGRVLQDTSKLNEYDVNGKVVHLVQRPPPSANQRPNQGRESPPPQPQPHRRIRGLEYLGSMRFPASAFDQNLMPPLPTHSLAASRLNVARRMLRRAEAVLNALENPTARPSEQPSQEEQQEDVTPVFEARVIVPNIASNEPIDEAVVLSAVHDSFLNVNTLSSETLTVTRTAPEGAAPLAEAEGGTPNSSDIEAPHSISSTPEVISPLATSSENLTTAGIEQQGNGEETSSQGANNVLEGDASNSANNASASGSSTAENVSHTAEYADLLDTLNRFQIRFAPFLERYNNFMREDPTVSQDNARPTQAMINRVSEILHFLGHAYHSLSDIIVRVRTPPPRPLLCRPILIQHSAIVQAGIPIQVEAQINFSANRNNVPGNGTGNGTATSQPPSSTTTTSTNATTNAAAATATSNQQTTTAPTTTASNTGPTITAHMQPAMVGFPLIPGTGVRVETFHLPQGSVNIERNDLNRNNNNNRDDPIMSIRTADIIAQVAASAVAAAAAGAGAGVGATASEPPPSAPTLTTPPNTTRENPNRIDLDSFANAFASNLQSAISGATGGGGSNPNSNPNVEFFMEVTPESITIDSLETAFVSGSQGNDVPQVSVNSPPPELIQSIMQMAGQLINRGAGTTSTTAPSAPPSEGSATDSQSATNGGSAARTVPFQNSQARGNTQTQPTTATQTRSTARPHVHLAQHAMQGFDPFLPCNSHHVTPRRRFHHQHLGGNGSTAAATAAALAAAGQQQNATQAGQQGQTNNGVNRPGPEGASEPRIMDQNNPFYNIMRSIINTVRAAYINQHGAAQPGIGIGMTASGSNVNLNSSGNVPQASPPWMSNLQNMNLSDLRTPTIAQLLQQLPDDSYTEGESIFTDLIMLLSRNLTIGDVLQLNGGRLEPLLRMRTQLRNFFLYRILDGSQNTASVNRGVQKLMSEMQPVIDHLALLDTRDDIDVIRSVETLLRIQLPNIISLAASHRPNSLKLMMDQLRTTAKYLCALVMRASRNGRQDVENVFDVIVTRYMQGIPRDLQQWTLMTSRTQLSAFLENLNVPEATLQPYIVKKVDYLTANLVEEQENCSSVSDGTSEAEPMQVEEEEIVMRSNNEDELMPPLNLADNTEPLPEVVLGSESWHGQVPDDWVPIITRDSQRQRRQNSQPPFSDAYLSGMPSKRRKIVTSSKPQGSLPQVITESVRRAVTATGLTSATPVETVAQAAGADLNIQSAYRDLLRSSVQSGLRDNADFTPERFPNASNYFNHPQ